MLGGGDCWMVESTIQGGGGRREWAEALKGGAHIDP